jgi:hypothetical protein
MVSLSLEALIETHHPVGIAGGDGPPQQLRSCLASIRVRRLQPS